MGRRDERVIEELGDVARWMMEDLRKQRKRLTEFVAWCYQKIVPLHEALGPEKNRRFAIEKGAK